VIRAVIINTGNEPVRAKIDDVGVTCNYF